MNSYTSVSKAVAVKVAHDTLDWVQRNREVEKNKRIHKASKRWWARLYKLIARKPLTDEQILNIIDHEWEWHWWRSEQTAKRVLALCKHSDTGSVFLTEEDLEDLGE